MGAAARQQELTAPPGPAAPRREECCCYKTVFSHSGTWLKRSAEKNGFVVGSYGASRAGLVLPATPGPPSQGSYRPITCEQGHPEGHTIPSPLCLIQPIAAGNQATLSAFIIEARKR
mmetsp:Transcript_9227/g.22651  ORF Transcript_9227/g.22651 Transcript_9227/m.22651 type:complete len:117 (+) Transcript_9227:340-690(+)